MSGQALQSEREDSLFPEIIETDRLRMEPRTPEYVDVQRCYEICAHEDGIEAVTQWVPWDPHESITETEEFLERGRRQREEGNGAVYVLRPRDGEDGAGEIAGFGGINCDWEKNVGILGVWLRKPFWGRGYSGERAEALVELAFDHLGFDLVGVGHEHRNEKSESAIRRYVERLGGRREGVRRNDIAYVDGSIHTEASYTITREEWLTATDGGTAIL
jgi:RimJ/RimL family protein N-acetyltransferase